MIAYGITDIGKVRTDNQDSYKMAAFNECCGTAIICDGMGGPGGGQIASSLAVEKIFVHLKENFKESYSSEKLCKIIAEGISMANAAVFKQSTLKRELNGMGTTVVMALYTENKIIFANIGDSRAYLIRGGVISQITKDHSVVQEMIARGEITKFQAKYHPKKNIITRALGVDVVCEPDFYILDVEEDDAFVLCSDGLTNHVDETEISLEYSLLSKPKAVLEKLVAMANQRGGTDNITASIIC